MKISSFKFTYWSKLVSSLHDTIIPKYSIELIIPRLLWPDGLQEFQIGGEGGGRVLKKINNKFYKHCMLTTIKVYAYYAAKIHKNKPKIFQTVSQY